MGWEDKGQEEPLGRAEKASQKGFITRMNKILMGGGILCTKKRTKHWETGTCTMCLEAGKGPVS